MLIARPLCRRVSAMVVSRGLCVHTPPGQEEEMVVRSPDKSTSQRVSDVARAGETVLLHYTAVLADGTEIDSTRRCGPVEFTLGTGQVLYTPLIHVFTGFWWQLLSSVEAEVEGMRTGDTKHIIVPPEKAYGDRDESLVMEVPRSKLPPNVHIGDKVLFSFGDDVVDVDSTSVVHPGAAADAGTGRDSVGKPLDGRFPAIVTVLGSTAEDDAALAADEAAAAEAETLSGDAVGDGDDRSRSRSQARREQRSKRQERDVAVLDANHPLSGETLHFYLELDALLNDPGLKLEGGVRLECQIPGDEVHYPRVGDRVLMHYSGTLARTGVHFDSSRSRSRPFEFTIGVGNVISGWDVGVAQMSLGERATLHIPSHMGYGSKSNSTLIPANSDLVFDVELLRIGSHESPQLHEYENIPD